MGFEEKRSTRGLIAARIVSFEVAFLQPRFPARTLLESVTAIGGGTTDFHNNQQVDNEFPIYRGRFRISRGRLVDCRKSGILASNRNADVLLSPTRFREAVKCRKSSVESWHA
jgi:hypothetical protein